MGPFSRVYSSRAISKKKKVLPLRSSGKCHAILSCVGGIAAMVVGKEPQLSNQQEAGRLEETKKRNRCADNASSLREERETERQRRWDDNKM